VTSSLSPWATFVLGGLVGAYAMWILGRRRTPLVSQPETYGTGLDFDSNAVCVVCGENYPAVVSTGDMVCGKCGGTVISVE